MPSALLIYNPNAGRFPPAETAAQAAEVLCGAGWTMQVESTRDADHVTHLAAEAANRGLDALIVAGGDGSIGRTVPGLLGTKTALGILPTGTANVWAQELGLPKISPRQPDSVRQNAMLLAHAQIRDIDVGECNGVPFLLWAGLGLDAMVVGRAELKRSHFRKHFVVPEYFARTLLTAARWPGAKVRIHGLRADGLTQLDFKGCFQLALVSNVRLYAGGLAAVSPAACLDDGEMDIWLFEGRGAIAALRNAWNLYSGKHVQDVNTHRLAFRELTITSETPIHLHTDGDPRPAANRIDLVVHQRALKILLPSTAPAALLS